MTHSVSSPMRLLEKIWALCKQIPPALAVGAGFFFVGLIKIGQPPRLYFDEYDYVTAARHILHEGKDFNWAHPPLGKFLIATGIQVFGDRPFGWRIASLIFGSIACMFIFLWADKIFKSKSKALFVVVLCALNQIHLVQSRIAMLDVFLVCFMVGGFYFFSAYLLERENLALGNRNLIGAAVCFALAGACKWFGLIGCFICAIGLIVEKRKEPGGKFFGQFKKLAFLSIAMGGLFLLVIYISFRSLDRPQLEAGDFISMQLRMLTAQLNVDASSHPYSSSWWQWPIMLKPTLYDREFSNLNGVVMQKTYFCMANPLLLAFGLIATVICLIKSSRVHGELTRWLLLIYFSLWLFWAVLPRKTEFFFYYYPAVMVLPFLICRALEILKAKRAVYVMVAVLCALAFIWFGPLSFGRPLDATAIRHRTIYPDSL